MGNIPVATVLSTNGVLFSGIMGFIYSDLMAPFVAANAEYHGWTTTLYIIGFMFASIVATALIANTTFTLVAWIPEGARQITELTPFNIDYTFWMNVASVAVVGGPIYLRRQHRRMHAGGHGGHDHGEDKLSLKRAVVYLFIALLIIGLIAFAVTGGVR